MAARSINQDDLRNHNLSVVLNAILGSVDPVSRAYLARKTRLTRATLSLLVPLLIDAQVVQEGLPISQKTGRPSTPLLISNGPWCGCGIQINTDGYGILIQDLKGKVIYQDWRNEALVRPKPSVIFEQLDLMMTRAEQILESEGKRIVGCTLALPGLVKNGTILLNAFNLGWKNLNLREFPLIDRQDVYSDNEGTLAALAQLPCYASHRDKESELQPDDSFIYISTDIGIGGAIVREGQIDRGENGFAGEIGHFSVSLDGPLCRCGRHGCVEAYAGRKSLVEASGIASGDAAADNEALYRLVQAYEAREPRAIESLERAVKAMASALASVINLTDIHTVVLGNLWSRFPKSLVESMSEQISQMVVGGEEIGLKILVSEYSVSPALRGAAAHGLRKFVDNPLPYIQEFM